MDWLFATLSEEVLAYWETAIDEWMFVVALGVLALEFIRYAVRGEFSWSLFGDAIVSYVTLAGFLLLYVTFLIALYIGAYYTAAEFALFDIPVTWASVLFCIVLADLAYYWEHRFTHRVNIAWATHSVHHSSPFYNISVANRFGPMDGIWPIVFHVPLVLLGFHPIVVIFAEVVVLTYQTLLHTEAVKKLPRPFEWIFNTPSHHRVHHGSNPQYLDANYGGMFIVWDRMFGTFVEEDEKVVYGLVKPIPPVNTPGRFLVGPFVAMFHGFWRVGRKLGASRSLGDVWMALFAPPGWTPTGGSVGPTG
jgi:sterol desaturase/sphingolipid hydroxylase (fatty acid hydroxylase superfamily)